MCAVYASCLQYSNLLIFCIMVCQTSAKNAIITCTFSVSSLSPQTVDISDLQKKNNLIHLCGSASKIKLEGESTLTADGIDNAQEFLDWVFFAYELEMCVSVENAESLKRLIISTASVVGNCEGPMINLVNNTNLYLISIRNKDFGKNMASVAMRIRGNRKLHPDDMRTLENMKKKVNANWDLQPAGECTLPKPFTSFKTLDQNCTNYYGPLVIQEGLTKFQYDLSKVHSFNLEGCIQIQRTELKDIAFLSAFSKFRRMPSCNQFVRDNKKLCPRNLEYLNLFFKDIQFSNNNEQPCDECIGGFVSEYYLRKSVNCSTVYGDLIIANFRGIPSNFENLRRIKVIEGRLIIVNNTGLQKFDYLTSLKKVGRVNGEGTVITIKDNGDLNFPEYPSFLKTQLKKEDERIEIVNNPMIFGNYVQTSVSSTSVAERSTSCTECEESSTANEDSDMIACTPKTNKNQKSRVLNPPSANKCFKGRHSSKYDNDFKNMTKTGIHTNEESSPLIKEFDNSVVFGGIAAVASLVVLCSIAIFLAFRQKTSAVHLLHSGPQETTKGKTTLLAITRLSTSRSTIVSSRIDATIKTTSSSSATEQVRRLSEASSSQHKCNLHVFKDV